VIACPGRGKSTILIPALIAAGLPRTSVTSLDATRKRLYGSVSILGGYEVEKETRLAEAELMERGRSVVRDATGLNPKVRRTDILRAHSFGYSAVALLASTLSLREIRRRNASRAAPVPDDVLVSFYLKAQALTVAGLLDEGFDSVVVWNDRTTFTLN
jgi:predicted kinase